MTRQSVLPSVAARKSAAQASIALTRPHTKGQMALEECLLKRRSVRSYGNAALSVADISQLLWAAQGITAEGDLRTAPSAGALYPLEIYLVAGNVDDLSPGLYHYRPKRHDLVLVQSGDLRRELARAALGQDCVANASAVFLFAAVYVRTAAKYGQRAARYVYMEAGHAAQNVCLQATALGLGAVTVGAFEDDEVKSLAMFPESHDPIYLLPVGRR